MNKGDWDNKMMGLVGDLARKAYEDGIDDPLLAVNWFQFHMLSQNTTPKQGFALYQIDTPCGPVQVVLDKEAPPDKLYIMSAHNYFRMKGTENE